MATGGRDLPGRPSRSAAGSGCRNGSAAPTVQIKRPYKMIQPRDGKNRAGAFVFDTVLLYG